MPFKRVLWLVGFLLIAGSVFLFLTNHPAPTEPDEPAELPPVIFEETDTPTTTEAVIGQSVEQRDIEAYTFGTGDVSLLFVGGIHGGYEWNSILLAYEMMDYLRSHPEIIPENVTVHVIPNLNPDGLFTATGLEGRFTADNITSNAMHTSGTGRFNANDVDLNRNFACKWAPESSWRGKVVDAGDSAFSEPEARALRDYVLTIEPRAVVFWHSMAGNVYASECENGVLPETLTLMNTYALAGKYGAVATFDAYPVTGDSEGWLASIGIPAVTVELGSRTSTEWEKNRAGTEAVLEMYKE
ncbi:hypothetical protein KC902_04515 [Candidatus Kaiserbacteria bacterium]|nr:hypothetical protein [Candidatus Kaiserbacteria bacterium]USN89165.1 MAG: hypothetical protein H6780_01965 [Candidatus Nomurabacteria bacterium]